MTRMLSAALLVVLGCAAAPSTPGTTAVHPSGRVPQAIGNVAVTDSTVFPTKSAGVSYRYGSGEVTYDVYLYRKRSWPDPLTQAQVFIRSLAIEQRRGRFESYEVISNEPFNFSVGEEIVAGHEVMVKLLRKGVPRHSYMAVVSLPDTYVKFRITRRLENAGGERDFVKSWVEAYSTSLTSH